MRPSPPSRILAVTLAAALALTGCLPGARSPGGALTIYSAREEALVGPIIEQFRQASGLDVRVKYGTNAELVTTVTEEGGNSPADVFFATDPFQLAGIADKLSPLPADILDLVPSAVRASDGRWIGVTGRARVVVYNTQKVDPATLPASIDGYTDPKWRGRIGWAPTNGSFQAFLTAYRVTKGEDAARGWLLGIKANEPKAYSNNTGVVDAVAKGEVEVGFVNHYYLYRFLKERGESFTARNHHFTNGDIGGMMLTNGLAVLKTSRSSEAALRFVRFLLSPVAQQYFASQTYEYPLIEGVATDRLLPPIGEYTFFQVDQIKLADTAGTLKALRDTGVLP
jgi:iron(III) transport system substrate-binding protein